MAFISLPQDVPGIMGLMKYRTDTGNILSELSEVLLRGGSPLSLAERELIAAYVSHRNECHFCTASHGAIAKHLFKDNNGVVDDVFKEIETANLSDKMKALLQIAAKVQLGGNPVVETDIQQAKEQGASDREIHDTVLISAAFCMFNRYVDALGTSMPNDPSVFQQFASQIAEFGYTDIHKNL